MKRGEFLRMLFGAFFVGLPLGWGVTGWTVYLRRVGPLRLGMTLAEVKRVLGDRRATLGDDPGGITVESCSYLESRKLPKGVSLMFQDGYVVRIDIDSPTARTSSGVGIGDTEESVKRAYLDRIVVEDHHYTDGHYLKYVPKSKADQAYGMVFETDGMKVVRFRIGTRAAVALVEGCS